MVLEEILTEKSKVISARKKILPHKKLFTQVDKKKPYSLKENLERKGFSIVAELKRGSPSAGVIDRDLDIKEKALAYLQAGVSGISVLTCEPYFYGCLEDLKVVRETVDIPLLMKDFIFDPYQILQGRVYGADVVLLILRILSDKDFKKLLDTAESLMMEVLVEVHTKEELERALRLVDNWKGKILGINNRNLETLETDLSVTLNLIKFIPQDKITVISESGIKDRRDVGTLKKAGLSGILVGESILKSKDVKEKIRELIHGEKYG